MTLLMANFWLVVSCSIILTMMKYNLLHSNLLIWLIQVLTISDFLDVSAENLWGICLMTMLCKDWNSWRCVVTARLTIMAKFFFNLAWTSGVGKRSTDCNWSRLFCALLLSRRGLMTLSLMTYWRVQSIVWLLQLLFGPGLGFYGR